MKEIEAKILEVDTAALESKLMALGAQKVFDGELISHYYDTGEGLLAQKARVLRLRTKGGKSVLTFKEKIPDARAKVMDEREVHIQDGDLGFIFEKLNLKVIFTSRKRRVSYLKRNVRYEMDFVPGIPPWLEIEAPDVNTLEHSAHELGFKTADLKSWNERDVLKHYGR